jgi:hypothetical protein
VVVTHPALTSDYCHNCGAMGGCECNDGLKMRAYQNMKKAEALTPALLDVEPTRTGHGH